MFEFFVSDQALNPVELSSRLANASCGALVTFEGWVRDHNEGKAVSGLSYEVYEALSRNEAAVILEEAKEKFELKSILAGHRQGELEIGGVAVWIGVVAVHRGAAFAGCQYMIDQIKLRLPIWKQEHYVDGTRQWVNCPECEKHRHDHGGNHCHDATH